MYEGRHGEANSTLNRLYDGIAAGLPGNAGNFSWAGITDNGANFPASDDNFNANLGGDYNDPSSLMFPAAITLPAFQHPLDLHAIGGYTTPGTLGKGRDSVAVGKHRYRRYNNFGVHPTTGYLAANTEQAGVLMPGKLEGVLLDDEAETIYEPAQACCSRRTPFFRPAKMPRCSSARPI